MDLCLHGRLFVMKEEDVRKIVDQPSMEIDQPQSEVPSQSPLPPQSQSLLPSPSQVQPQILTEQQQIEQELRTKYVLVFTDGQPNGKFKIVRFHSPTYDEDIKVNELNKPSFPHPNKTPLLTTMKGLRESVYCPFAKYKPLKRPSTTTQLDPLGRI